MATFTDTAKYALSWLTGSNLISDIDLGFQTLAEDVDANMAGYAEGTFAGKPAAGKTGRIYRCTDTGQWLADTGAAWVDLNAAPALVTSLPGSPFDGQEVYFSADPTNGIVWHFRYRSASASTYKWEFVGGSPLFAEVSTNQNIAIGAGVVDPSTVGPTITVPRAGDYEITFSLEAQMSASGTAGGGVQVNGSYDSTTEVFAGVISSGSGTPNRTPVRRNVTTAATDIKLRYFATGSGTTSVGNRILAVRPIRVI